MLEDSTRRSTEAVADLADSATSRLQRFQLTRTIDPRHFFPTIDDDGNRIGSRPAPTGSRAARRAERAAFGETAGDPRLHRRRPTQYRGATVAVQARDKPPPVSAVGNIGSDREAAVRRAVPDRKPVAPGLDNPIADFAASASAPEVAKLTSSTPSTIAEPTGSPMDWPLRLAVSPCRGCCSTPVLPPCSTPDPRRTPVVSEHPRCRSTASDQTRAPITSPPDRGLARRGRQLKPSVGILGHPDTDLVRPAVTQGAITSSLDST